MGLTLVLFFFTLNYRMIFLLSCLVPLQDPGPSDPSDLSDHDYEIVEEHLNTMLGKASEEVRFYF